MLLQCSGISKSYGTDVILSRIDLQIQENDRIGLVGVNGAGKSTLLKILAGELAPDSGQLYIAKEARIGYLAQNSGLDLQGRLYDELRSVYRPLLEMEEELRRMERKMADPAFLERKREAEQLMQRYAELSDRFRAAGGFEIDANVRAMMHGMGFGDFDPDTPIAALSGGQKTRLALARLLLQAPDLLMLDEPTNYLDIPTLTWLESYLRAYRGAVLVVSHDRYFLDAVAHAIVEIERHEARRYTGIYSKYIETKAHNYEIELKHYEKQQEEIMRMEDFIRRNLARASTTKRAQSRRKALERMERLERPAGDPKRASFAFAIDRMSGKDVLSVSGIRKSFPGKGDVLRDINFELKRGQSVALIGPNGAGKSTLLKILTGRESADAGTFRWGTNVKIGYYDQEQTELDETQTVLEEVWRAYPHLEEVRIRTVLGNFLFSGEDVKKKIGSLSGGEKARVSLAKLMLLGANVLVLDEPTNHLDLYSKEVLESALLEYEGTLLFISHDRYFLNKMADTILELSPDGLHYFLGNYDDYVEKKKELAELQAESRQDGGKSGAAAQAAKENAPSAYALDKQAKREERSRQRRIEQLEAQIMAIEERIAELEHSLTDPAVAGDYVKLQEYTEKLEQTRGELQPLYDEWEKLLAD
jgi:ATP-binding cassette subfamily F protein 3